jgi:hypothetical protein
MTSEPLNLQQLRRIGRRRRRKEEKIIIAPTAIVKQQAAMSNNDNNDNDKWETIIAGCNHKKVMTSKQILLQPIETRFDPATGRMENYYVCRDCVDEKRGTVWIQYCIKLLSLESSHRLEEVVLRYVSSSGNYNNDNDSNDSISNTGLCISTSLLQKNEQIIYLFAPIQFMV